MTAQPTEVTDYLIDVPDPRALDVTLQLLPGCTARVVGFPEPKTVDGHYVVRVFGDPKFFLFVMERQGTAKSSARASHLLDCAC